jgi:nicotinamide-nucleotide amidase
VIPNRHGTAPGLVIEEDGCTVFVLPGVPAEMRALLEEGVIPELAVVGGGFAPVVRSRMLRTAGIGESALAERLDDVLADPAPSKWRICPRSGWSTFGSRWRDSHATRRTAG